MRLKPVTLRWISNVLFMLALAIASWLIWLEWGTGLATSDQQDQTVSEVRKQIDALEDPVIEAKSNKAATSQHTDNSSNSSVDRFDVRSGDAFGVITIQRFGRDFEAPLLQDTDTDTLTRGVGHYTGTAAPCAVGNFSLAGHRTTYGRPFYNIDQLQIGDKIVIETLNGNCVYQVDSHKIVDPGAVSVLAPVPNRPNVDPTEAWLTMTACHPKYSAAKRYVVFAKLVETN